MLRNHGGMRRLIRNAGYGWYRRACRAYPRVFRARFGADMRRTVLRDARGSSRGTISQVRFWIRTVAYAFAGGVSERLSPRTTRPTHLESSRPTTAGFTTDLRVTTRALWRRKALLVPAVITGALGLGAATVAYSVANWAVYRPLPGTSEPEALVTVLFGEGTPGRGRFSPASVSSANLADLVPRVPALTGIAGQQGRTVGLATSGSTARSAQVEFVSASFFSVLGARARFGRLLGPDDDRIDPPERTVVLGEELATTLFGSANTAVGDVIRINDLPATVVGVVAGFRGTEKLDPADLWIPLNSYAHFFRFPPEATWQSRGGGLAYEFVGRRAAGASPEAVEKQLNDALDALRAAFPDENTKFETARATVTDGVGVSMFARDDLRNLGNLLLGLMVVILAITTANLVNLLVFQAIARHREHATRRALGASWGRVVRTHLLESALLLAAGTVAGLGLAGLAMQWVGRITVRGVGSLEGIRLDGTVVAVGITIAVVATLVTAIPPAIRVLLTDPAIVLTGGARDERPGAGLLRRTLQVVQIGLTVPLMVGSLLLVRTILAYGSVSPGLDPAGRSLHILDLSAYGYDEDQSARTLSDLRRAVGDRPGVRRVAATMYAPFFGATFRKRVLHPQSGDTMFVSANMISDGYFAALGIPFRAGRDFTAEEAAARESLHPVMIVNEAFARDYFGSADVVGREVASPATRSQPSLRRSIIGVVADSRWRDLRTPPRPFVYIGLGAAALPSHVLVVQADVPSARTVIEEELARLNPAIPVQLSVTMEELMAQTYAEERLLTHLATVLAAIALLLSAVGLYGLTANALTARHREFGIRIAVGADRPQIRRLALHGVAVLVALGLALGTAGAVLAARALKGFLFGIVPFSPGTFLFSTALVVVSAAAATYIPVRWATRVDPVRAVQAQ